MVGYRKPAVNQLCLLIVLLFAALAAGLNSCNNKPEPPSLATQIADGKELAKRYCINCHQLPSPALLDRKTWERSVLPAMAQRLRLNSFMGGYFQDYQSLITVADWEKIVAYYKNMAPVSLIIPKPAVAPLSDWAIFSLKKPAKVNRKMPAMITMVSFDAKNRQVYTADVTNKLYDWDVNLNLKRFYKFDSPVTGLSYFNGTDTGIITCIGNMAPVDLSKGKVLLVGLNNKGEKYSNPVLIADSLPRPVQTVAADFNKDGLMDYVVCGFGHDSGGLYLLQQKPANGYKKTIISNIAGGEQLITGDFNNDGWPDVICLFAQANEGIRMFLNDHKGGFITKDLIDFPPVYGSSSFQLVDFNHDGKLDILYTCGDNSDYSKILKPYHGIYIFTNQGNWKFKQTYFYHINGCTKAIARDFDHDGDLDIAAIAFFADFKSHPQEGFTYLEQTGLNNFTAHEVPVNLYGRWLTMEVADIYNDGNDDIILGNFSQPGGAFVNQHGYAPNWDQNLPFIVLKNNSGKKIIN
jgi:hypothetical protein